MERKNPRRGLEPSGNSSVVERYPRKAERPDFFPYSSLNEMSVIRPGKHLTVHI